MLLSRKHFIYSPVVLIALSLAAAETSGPVRQVDPPTAPQSGMSFLTTAADGKVYLSWIDPLSEGGHALRFARWNGKTWNTPETIAAGKNWFVNWVDMPSIAALPDGSFLAHWLSRADGGGKHGYGIKIARRAAGSSQWKKIHGISLDEKEDYAGFLQFVPGQPAAIYLSPPQKAPPQKADAASAHNHGHNDHDHRKTVRFITFQPNGTLSHDHEVDADSCSCCPTSVARTPKGLIAAYRDHLPGEIRDISIIRLKNGSWSEPEPLHRDGWEINGCPTEGPSIATHESEVGITWLTRAKDEPRIQVALSHDGGEKFNNPIRIDDGNPLGRPSVVPFDSSSFLSLWVEKTADPALVNIRLRRIGFNGKISPALTVTSAPAGRTAGIPKMAIAGNQVIVTWRNDRVRTTVLPMSLISKDLQ